MVNDPDESNFLDHDEVEAVSSNLYDWTFDQVIVMGLPAIASDERKPINWYCPDPMYTTKAIRHIGKLYEVSFSVAVQNALPHGFSIFQHKHQDLISLIGNLDDVAISNDSEVYVNHLVYKSTIGRDVRRMITSTDVTTADLMGNVASVIGTSRSHLSGVCILLSLSTGDVIPETVRSRFEKHIQSFETGLKMYQMMATNLI